MSVGLPRQVDNQLTASLVGSRGSSQNRSGAALTIQPWFNLANPANAYASAIWIRNANDSNQTPVLSCYKRLDRSGWPVTGSPLGLCGGQRPVDRYRRALTGPFAGRLIDERLGVVRRTTQIRLQGHSSLLRSRRLGAVRLASIWTVARCSATAIILHQRRGRRSPAAQRP